MSLSQTLNQFAQNLGRYPEVVYNIVFRIYFSFDKCGHDVDNEDYMERGFAVDKTLSMNCR